MKSHWRWGARPFIASGSFHCHGLSLADRAVDLPLLVALCFLSAVCVHKAVDLPLVVALCFLSAVCVHKAVDLPLLVVLCFLWCVFIRPWAYRC